jgi:hypothetical protein
MEKQWEIETSNFKENAHLMETLVNWVYCIIHNAYLIFASFTVFKNLIVCSE